MLRYEEEKMMSPVTGQLNVQGCQLFLTKIMKIMLWWDLRLQQRWMVWRELLWHGHRDQASELIVTVAPEA